MVTAISHLTHSHQDRYQVQTGVFTNIMIFLREKNKIGGGGGVALGENDPKNAQKLYKVQKRPCKDKTLKAGGGGQAPTFSPPYIVKILNIYVTYVP